MEVKGDEGHGGPAGYPYEPALLHFKRDGHSVITGGQFMVKQDPAGELAGPEGTFLTGFFPMGLPLFRVGCPVMALSPFINLDVIRLHPAYVVGTGDQQVHLRPHLGVEPLFGRGGVFMVAPQLASLAVIRIFWKRFRGAGDIPGVDTPGLNGVRDVLPAAARE